MDPLEYTSVKFKPRKRCFHLRKCICECLSIKLHPSLSSGCGKLPIFETVELLGNVLKAALQEIDVCHYLNKVVSFKCCLVWNHKKFVLKAFRCVSSPHRLWYNHTRHRYDTDSTCCGWSTDALDDWDFCLYRNLNNGEQKLLLFTFS